MWGSRNPEFVQSTRPHLIWVETVPLFIGGLVKLKDIPVSNNDKKNVDCRFEIYDLLSCKPLLAVAQMIYMKQYFML